MVLFHYSFVLLHRFLIVSNMRKIIGRERELYDLQRCLDSDKSEFVVVYGRRRVGKTFLVDYFFNRTYDFSFTGGHKLSMRRQLTNFAKAMKLYSHLPKRPQYGDWFDAFDALEEYLGALDKERRKVIFFDEMPWIDTRNSEFVMALENFWNGWAARRDDILFVASGSATSWMVDNLLDNQGGLHGRIETRIYLHPFTLHETEDFLRSRHITWDHYQILQTYMALGGIPYYLDLLDRRESLIQNIDRLYFTDSGTLRTEFDELYNATFTNADSYIRIVQTLAAHREGLTRKQIVEMTHIEGGVLTKMLRNLERCDFIHGYQNFGNKVKDIIYRLIDFYTLFYFRFIANDNSEDEHWWSNHISSPRISSWQGFTFELVSLVHLHQIKRALGITAIGTDTSAWRQAANKEREEKGAQIDLIISRADRIIHLCEMKFSAQPYHMTSSESDKLRERAGIFQAATKTSHTLVHTYVTTFGVANPESWSILHSQVLMDDLFQA